MADSEERQVGGLRIRIDRGLCVGFGDCVEAAPEAFRLDGEGVVVFDGARAGRSGSGSSPPATPARWTR